MYQVVCIKAWKLEGKTDCKELFDYFSCCVQGRAAVHWKGIVAEHCKNPQDWSHNKFMKLLPLYVEKVANQTYIGDSIIYYITHWKRHVVCTIPDYCTRIKELREYVKQ